jgi:transposase InsO family protein
MPLIPYSKPRSRGGAGPRRCPRPRWLPGRRARAGGRLARLRGTPYEAERRHHQAVHSGQQDRSARANAMWQADHTPLDVLLLDETGTPAKPWLTVIEDDYSRAIVGYRLSFQEATALTTALTLRQAI